MIGIGTAAKWLAILAIVSAISYGIKAGYNYHKSEIAEAVNTAQLEFAVEKQEALDAREVELRELSRADREEIEVKLIAERARVNDLQRMLLIDHDLDRLLQRKPGLILPRVNKGTEAVLLELEELTQ